MNLLTQTLKHQSKTTPQRPKRSGRTVPLCFNRPAANGIVYLGGAGSGGTLYAVNEANGAVLWTASVANGDDSSPALSRDGVYVSYPCQVYKFSPQSGSKLWQYSGGCSGGGGNTPVYHLGRLYVWDWSSTQPGYVFNSKTGQLLSTYQASLPPALLGNLGVFLNARTLEGRNLITQAVLWSFAGDGSLSSAILVRDLSAQAIRKGSLIFLPFVLFSLWAAWYLWQVRSLY